MPKPKITLDADLYDYLELSSLAEGGIGAGSFYLVNGEPRNYRFVAPNAVVSPMCVYGHALIESCVLSEDLRAAGIESDDNDKSVRAINARRHRPCDERVPFALWAPEMGVVRGPHNYVGEFPIKEVSDA